MPRNFLPNKSTLYLLTLVLAFVSEVAAQDDTHGVYWLRYQNQANFSQRVYWNNEFDNRRFINPDVQTQFILHSRLHYKRDRWDYGGGITFSWAYASLAEKPVDQPTMEVRPVIEASYEIPMKKWSLAQRLRIDNRFIEEHPEESIFDGSNYIMRFRYRVLAKLVAVKNERGQPLIGLRIADEIMFNHKENFFDQNRVYVSSEFTLNKAWAIEAGYIYIYQQRFGTDVFLERHVARFSLLHRLFLY